MHSAKPRNQPLLPAGQKSSSIKGAAICLPLALGEDPQRFAGVNEEDHTVSSQVATSACRVPPHCHRAQCCSHCLPSCPSPGSTYCYVQFKEEANECITGQGFAAEGLRSNWNPGLLNCKP
ncbi:hypothetical protein MC885_017222 [Smutsia gigantea]|nr:hypothetical protein MC885_017222 [Smutsia gigantea]